MYTNWDSGYTAHTSVQFVNYVNQLYFDKVNEFLDTCCFTVHQGNHQEKNFCLKNTHKKDTAIILGATQYIHVAYLFYTEQSVSVNTIPYSAPPHFLPLFGNHKSVLYVCELVSVLHIHSFVLIFIFPMVSHV